VLRDQLSRRVILHSCTASDSVNAFDGITACIKEHGLPIALYSDTASHFVSGLIQELEDAFTMELLFAVPYSPWTKRHGAGRPRGQPGPQGERRGARAQSWADAAYNDI
jgi:hypothetical protein